MTGESGRAIVTHVFGHSCPTTCATIEPSPPNGECSSMETTAFALLAWRTMASRSKGLTQYMSSTEAETPLFSRISAASTAGLTISPHATSSTSSPSRTSVALSIWNGQPSSVYTSSTALRPTRM